VIDGDVIKSHLSFLSDAHPWILYGIVSWGEGCGDGSPGVYAKVSSVVNWLADFGQVTKDSNVAKIIPEVQSVRDEGNSCFVEIKESQQFGVIKNENYPESSKNVNCTWIFAFKEEKKVKFLLDHLELRPGSQLSINVTSERRESRVFDETSRGGSFEVDGEDFGVHVQSLGIFLILY
jgi:hypothetical protein